MKQECNHLAAVFGRRFVCDPKARHRVHKSPPVDTILSQINRVHTIPSWFLKFRFEASLRDPRMNESPIHTHPFSQSSVFSTPKGKLCGFLLRYAPRFKQSALPSQIPGLITSVSYLLVPPPQLIPAGPLGSQLHPVRHPDSAEAWADIPSFISRQVVILAVNVLERTFLERGFRLTSDNKKL
jgi:hypothetical protein